MGASKENYRPLLEANNRTRSEIVSDYTPAGDQPEAIGELLAGIKAQEKESSALGVTGSGKTFTMAHVIQEISRPTIVLALNKTLAAQLYGEMKSFFPKTPSNISYLIMTTISRRRMFHDPTLTLKKMHQSMSK